MTFSLVLLFKKRLHPSYLRPAEALCLHFHSSGCCVRADHTPSPDPPHTCWETTSHPALYANPHTRISIWKVWVVAFLEQSASCKQITGTGTGTGPGIWPVLSFQWNSYNQWEGWTLTSVLPAACMVINISSWILITRNWSVGNNSKHEL